jgi:hypothetical protein
VTAECRYKNKNTCPFFISFKTSHPSSGIDRLSNMISHAVLAYTLAPSAKERLIFLQLSISVHEFIPESAHFFLKLIISATSVPVFCLYHMTV